MAGLDWSKYETQFDRFPKLNDKLKNAGDSVVVEFKDDGKLVEADLIKDKLIGKGIKARDSVVFNVQGDDGQKYEFWLSAQNYSALRELANIRKSTDSGTLIGVKVRITRISTDPNQTNFKFEKLE